MVKQGSFFQRLKDRWGSGSGVRVERSAAPAGKVPEKAEKTVPLPRVEPERVASASREVANEFAGIDARSSRKMSDREEAMLALSTHFQELTSLLRGSQARVDDQLTKIVGTTSALTQLPALGWPARPRGEAAPGAAGRVEAENASPAWTRSWQECRAHESTVGC